jgi:tRNA modification GTPase
MVNSTIAAIATPTGRGGIGIIRISGPMALHHSIKHFLFFSKNKTASTIESHKLYYGHIVDKNKTIIDEVLFVYMKSPKTYTAEDVVEIQSHSSPVVLRLILDILIEGGISLAEPGEFTKRAFLNGRIDLTQAEAVIDIINAKSKSSLDIALSQINGRLGDSLKLIKNKIIELKSYIEAIIDFPEEVEEDENFRFICDNINSSILSPLQNLSKNFDQYSFYKDGIKIVIAGPPNSGKSSLMNLLINKEKSIVTNIPGTTRDLIEDLISLEGIPCILTDTAGLRTTDDLVEKIGISKAYERLDIAELILVISDASQQLKEDDLDIINSIYYKYNKTKPILFLNNKTDIGKTNNHELIDFNTDFINISVKQNHGIDILKNKIVSVLLQDFPDDNSSLVPNLRHNTLIVQIIKRIKNIIELINTDFQFELIAIDINECINFIDEILGINCKIDILDEIFGNFCIGK